MDTLIYWQKNRAAAFWMANECREDGDYQSAIYWQEYAAHCHRCFLSNQERV